MTIQMCRQPQRRFPMNAKTIAKALGGRKAGRDWTARCPAHDDRTPSLSLRDAEDGKVLVCCHAGCDQNKVISNLQASGLWTPNGTHPHAHFSSRRLTIRTAPDSDDCKRTEAALSIWKLAKSAAGTLVETYLRSRGLSLPSASPLRFHTALKHPTGGIWPAMIALVTRGPDDVPLAIHRTFLAYDGTGKASADRQKMMLGPCRGGAVRLAAADDVLMVGEGIETCLAAMQEMGYPAWAALSTSGLRALELPKYVRNVIVLADGDEAGEAAARDCSLRWAREGRRVRIARASRGMDFNDMLLRGLFSVEEGAR